MLVVLKHEGYIFYTSFPTKPDYCAHRQTEQPPNTGIEGKSFFSVKEKDLKVSAAIVFTLKKKSHYFIEAVVGTILLIT